MSNKKTVQRDLSASQIGQLEKELTGEKRAPGDRSLESGGELLSGHLTDEEFLQCMDQPMLSSIPPRLDSHLQICPECIREFARLQECMQAIKDASILDRTRQRVLSRFENQSRPSGLSANGFADGLMRQAGQTWVSLRPFFQHQAVAADYSAEADRIEFPIIEAGNSVPGLIGVLLKRSDEYYAKVEATDNLVLESFRDRFVRLTIVDPIGNIPVFERTIQIGLIVFIGTGLKGTHNLSAELL